MEKYTLELADDNLHIERIRCLFSKDYSPSLSAVPNVAAEKSPIIESALLIIFNKLRKSCTHTLFGGRRREDDVLYSSCCSTEKHIFEDDQNSKPANGRTALVSVRVTQHPWEAETIHDEVPL